MKLKIALVAVMIATPAFAQQPPQQDAATSACLQLTNEANGRVIETIKNAAALQAKLQAAEARVKELEAKELPKK